MNHRGGIGGGLAGGTVSTNKPPHKRNNQIGRAGNCVSYYSRLQCRHRLNQGWFVSIDINNSNFDVSNKWLVVVSPEQLPTDVDLPGVRAAAHLHGGRAPSGAEGDSVACCGAGDGGDQLDIDRDPTDHRGAHIVVGSCVAIKRAADIRAVSQYGCGSCVNTERC